MKTILTFCLAFLLASAFALSAEDTQAFDACKSEAENFLPALDALKSALAQNDLSGIAFFFNRITAFAGPFKEACGSLLQNLNSDLPVSQSCEDQLTGAKNALEKVEPQGLEANIAALKYVMSVESQLKDACFNDKAGASSSSSSGPSKSDAEKSGEASGSSSSSSSKSHSNSKSSSSGEASRSSSKSDANKINASKSSSSSSSSSSSKSGAEKTGEASGSSSSSSKSHSNSKSSSSGEASGSSSRKSANLEASDSDNNGHSDSSSSSDDGIVYAFETELRIDPSDNEEQEEPLLEHAKDIFGGIKGIEHDISQIFKLGNIQSGDYSSTFNGQIGQENQVSATKSSSSSSSSKSGAEKTGEASGSSSSKSHSSSQSSTSGEAPGADSAKNEASDSESNSQSDSSSSSDEGNVNAFETALEIDSSDELEEEGPLTHAKNIIDGIKGIEHDLSKVFKLGFQSGDDSTTFNEQEDQEN